MAKEGKRRTSAETAKVSEFQNKAEAAKQRLAVWNSYIAFGVSKAFGVTALVTGALETVDPNLLSIVLPHSLWFMGGGLAMLTGKNAVSLLAKAGALLDGLGAS